ncbi:DNA gyrase subunit A [Candidatus Woesearchaeota archaeon]|nr:DNA gyrase subunit A [Candidatus Woesearchaeota archaeon]
MTEEDIQQRLIEQEMKESYVDYAMSVIISRALPDIRDGLKPVHRRILFTMYKMGLTHTKPFKKSARITGTCMGRYHPHGNLAIYESLARMAQDFSLRYPLVDGQGNWGSIDGFKPAAERYTEARLKKIAEEMLQDIDKKTVQFVPNYDNTEREPAVLPSKLPNLLINGSTGIAVGMATNIPPHNIGEIIDASVACIDNPNIEIGELLKHIKGPDFPTGGLISGLTGLREAYEKGKGKIIVKAKTSIEDRKIIVTEIPYMVNKTALIENIVELVKEGNVEGIADIRDESDREGLRIVFELKKSADPQLVLNQLYAQSMLKTTFGIIMLAVHENQPVIFNIKDAIKYHISHRKDVVTRRTQFELQRAEDRNHIVLGLITALDHIDPVVKLIKESDNVDVARQGLIQQYQLTEIQANAILDMRLQKLTSLETNKLKQEHADLKKIIQELKDILASEPRIFAIIKQEFLELKEKYADARKTEITAGEEVIEEEDLIKEETVVVTITHSGYIKKLPVETYKQQRRGGQGIIGAETGEENDIVKNIFTTSNLNYLLLFTSQGKVHWLKAYEVPTASRYAKGKAIVNLVRLGEGEKVSTILSVAKFNDQEFITMVTKKGVIKKTNLNEFANPRQGGIRAINLLEGDELVAAQLTPGNLDIILGTKKGIASRFNEGDIRAMGRTATGVRGIKLEQGDEVIGMQTTAEGTTLLTVKEDGYGKRTAIDEYRQIHRGGKGIINIKTEGKNDNVIGIIMVNDDDEIILMSQKSIVIRTAVKDISSIGRNTQGVRIMKLKEGTGDKVMTIAKVVKSDNGQ